MDNRELMYIHNKNDFLYLQSMYNSTGGGVNGSFNKHQLTFFTAADRLEKKYTASYIYTRDKTDSNKYYFAVCRKIPLGARIRIKKNPPNPTPNTGAAGTEQRYFGKWSSFGGGIKYKNWTNVSRCCNF